MDLNLQTEQLQTVFSRLNIPITLTGKVKEDEKGPHDENSAILG